MSNVRSVWIGKSKLNLLDLSIQQERRYYKLESGKLVNR